MVVRFGLLGEVEARVDDQVVDLGPARQRCVLAALLVDVNRPVPVEVLLDRVWGDRLPRRGREGVYSYLSRLRRALAGTPVRIDRQSAGYMLVVDPMAVDLHRFRDLLAAARAAGDDEDAAGLLEQALRLWRGEAFATLDTPWITSVRDGLDRERLAAVLDRNDVALRRGEHGALLAELFAAAAAHPWDERLGAQLMLALYRCGRQGDALAHYERVRLLLGDELGADPSPALQRLHGQILSADPALAASTPVRASAAPGPAGSAVPRQLPIPPRSFTGRRAELAQLDAVLTPEGELSSSVVVAVSGAPGVGKTALALYWAHRAADRFADGQLYVDLRGFDPSGSVLDPADAVGGFLDALAVPPQRIPSDPHAQSALYRSLIADKQLLVVLDNARDTQQIRPLLPGSPRSRVVVTSRNRLSSLVTVEGAHPVTLDLLSIADAPALLAGRIGHDRAAAQPAAVDDIIGSCARLPLALAIVAARAASHPDFPLHTIAGELHETGDRLDALSDADPAGDVRAVFSWSYQRLSADAARLFRLLGLAPGADLTARAAASLAGLPLGRTRTLLAELTHAHLLTEHAPSRYTFHDLLRAYAAEQAHRHDSDTDVHVAISRVLDHYLVNAFDAAAAMDLWSPAAQLRAPRSPASATPLLPGTDRTAARAWLDAERGNLVAACGYAADHGWTEHVIDLARVLARYLDAGGHHGDAFSLHTRALHASRSIGDKSGEAAAFAGLGLVLFRRGEVAPAAEHLQHALTLSRQVGDQATEAWAVTILGAISWAQGQFAPAVEHLEHALTLSRQVGDHATEAMALTYLGAISWAQGRLAPAVEHLEHALTLSQQVGNRGTEAMALTYLGAISLARGQLALAAEHLQDALALCREVGDRHGEAWALTLLGGVGWRRGELQSAAEHLQHALTLCRLVGDRAAEAMALIFLGGVGWRRGELQSAAEHLQHALTLCRQVGDRASEAWALTLLAGVGWRRGELQSAAEHLQHALTLCRQLGDRAVEEMALTLLGGICWRRGELQPAAEHLQHALTLCRQLGDRATEAMALTLLGLLSQHQGQQDRAIEHLQQGLALARQTDDRGVEVDALTGLGIVYSGCGEPEPAVEHLQQALTLCRRLGYRASEADALAALGETLWRRGSAGNNGLPHTRAPALAGATGDSDGQPRTEERTPASPQAVDDLHQARQHWQQALIIYAALDLPEAERLRSTLHQLDHSQPRV